MPSDKAKSFFRWAGSGLSILGVIFVIGKLKDYGSEIDISVFATMAFPILGLSVVYGLANLLLAFAWKDLLNYFDEPIGSFLAIRIYGESQLAKYVPGNVFHFVGRQALGLEAGLPAWPLAKSAIWEIGMLVVAGSMFITVVIPYFQPGFSVIFALVLFALVVLIIMWVSNRWYSHWIARAMAWHMAFLVLTGLVFLTVLSLIAPAENISGSVLVFICGSYVVAWLAGLVTPGAPAGVGIREVVLFALLKPIVSEADLLAAVIFGRIVTVGGDILFYLSALLINSQNAKID